MPVKVKICGLTNAKDAQEAANAGADFLGFIFYPKSSRFIQPEKVREILLELDCHEVKTVGVFVDQEPTEIYEIIHFCGLDFAQLHGDESPSIINLSDIEGRKNPLYGRCYKAIKPQDKMEALELADRFALPPQIYAAHSLPAFLMDSYHPTLPGGTGQIGDWQIAFELVKRYPVMLAGGLTIHNLQQVVREISPWGVDVASGTEAAPGIKDHNIMRQFIRLAKEIER